jgi:hypothetical protein
MHQEKQEGFMKGRLSLLPLGCIFLFACSKPLPPDKVNYAGNWQEKSIHLIISREGKVNYQRRQGSGTASVNAPILRFEGNDFLVGIGPVHTTFVVQRPPYEEHGQWKMRVDGVELIRTEP